MAIAEFAAAAHFKHVVLLTAANFVDQTEAFSTDVYVAVINNAAERHA